MKLPEPASVLNRYPAPQEFIENQREMAKAIAKGADPRLLIFVGPCSIHDEASALEYASRLKQLSEEVKDHCLLIMRAFLEKPRTARGWNGLLHDPRLDGSFDLSSGLWLARKLLQELAEMGVPVACEFLEPLAAPYLTDLVTWGIIGARTSSSPLHRQLASSLPMPCGFKNSLDGSWEQAINSLLVAREKTGRFSIDKHGCLVKEMTKGNADAYLILRGSCRKPNCDELSIETALNDLEDAGLRRRLIVDCAHGNSGKMPKKQIEVFRSILDFRKQKEEAVFGIMLESFLEEGRQQIYEQRYGVSITDPCLDWASTQALIEEVAQFARL